MDKTVKIDVGINRMVDTYFTFRVHPLSRVKLGIGKEFPTRLSIAFDGKNMKLKDLSPDDTENIIRMLTGREDLRPRFKVWN